MSIIVKLTFVVDLTNSIDISIKLLCYCEQEHTNIKSTFDKYSNDDAHAKSRAAPSQSARCSAKLFKESPKFNVRAAQIQQFIFKELYLPL